MNKIGGGSADLLCVLCGGPTYSKPVITNTKLFKKLCNGVYHRIHAGFWEATSCTKLDISL